MTDFACAYCGRAALDGCACADRAEYLACSEDMIEAANERIQTIFAETAILLTHPDEARRELAKERVYAILFAPTPDRSGEAGETTKIGSTEGESGLPEGSSE